MKVEICREEVYPVYTLSFETLIEPIEVSQEFLDRYNRIEGEYQAMQ